jgi:hypothetical protein
MKIQHLMETNVYAIKGRVLIVGACFPQVFPEAFTLSNWQERTSRGYRDVCVVIFLFCFQSGFTLIRYRRF